ncbi:MAG: aldo/keto reductase [Phycisphaerae bacterium]
METATFAEDRYEKMNYRRCGRSGLLLPAVSVGFWQSLGQPGNEKTCRVICYEAFNNGITHFDLANNYGPPPGNSERVVGEILKSMPRDELIISTKAGYRHWPGPYGDRGSKKYLVASLDQSLARLGLEYVDIFYHHRPDPETPLEETMAALDLIVKQGKALYVGVSNYSGAQLRNACDVIKQNNLTPLTIHQPYYNMLGRGVETDLLPHTEAAGLGVIPFCPLAQGVLTDKYLGGLPDDSRHGQRGQKGQKWYDDHAQRGTWDKVAQLNEIADARGQTLAQMALTWLLRDQRVTSVLVGVSRVEQLLDNIDAANAEPLGEEELSKIEEILAG